MPAGENFKNADEKQTCCLCIEIQMGMKIMAILSMIGAVLTIISAASLLSTNPMQAISYFAQSLLGLFLAYKWFKWFKEDDSDNRAELVKWMRIQFFVNSAISIIFAILLLLGVGWKCECTGTEESCEALCEDLKSKALKIAIVPTIVGTGLGIAVMWYFYNVTKRYEAMSH